MKRTWMNFWSISRTSNQHNKSNNKVLSNRHYLRMNKRQRTENIAKPRAKLTVQKMYAQRYASRAVCYKRWTLFIFSNNAKRLVFLFFYFYSLFALVVGNQQENSVLLTMSRFGRNKIVGWEVTGDDSEWKQVSRLNIIFYIVSYVVEPHSLLWTESRRKVNVFSRYYCVLKNRVPLLHRMKSWASIWTY